MKEAAGLFESAPAIAQLRRDLAAAAAHVSQVLGVIAKWEGSVYTVSQIARAAGVSDADARQALIALEAVGLAESTHFRATPAGARDARAAELVNAAREVPERRGTSAANADK
jgi:DNA-binding IclR family transcriptional regulator